MDRATRDLKHDFNGENIALLTLISAYHADCNITKSAHYYCNNKAYGAPNKMCYEICNLQFQRLLK